MLRYSIFRIKSWRIFAAATEQGVCRIEILERDRMPPLKGDVFRRDDAYFAELRRQLEEYFSGQRRIFTVRKDITVGTKFQRKVWQALLTIPYGETRSYQEVAEMVGSPKAQRGVGMACRRNPLPILIPCHRVIRKNRTLGGYGGKSKSGLKRKMYLLRLEKGEPHL